MSEKEIELMKAYEGDNKRNSINFGMDMFKLMFMRLERMEDKLLNKDKENEITTKYVDTVPLKEAAEYIKVSQKEMKTLINSDKNCIQSLYDVKDKPLYGKVLIKSLNLYLKEKNEKAHATH